MKRFFLLFLAAPFFILIFPNFVDARIGVGVGTGKIQVEDKLRAGMIYELPSLTVLNTGDEPSDYEVAVTYHQDQPQLAPSQEWFDFSPQGFYLEPGEAQTVTIKLNLPLKTVPGDYFAYLEGHPIKQTKLGGANIGVAAAAKLYFTIAPANFLQGLYYKTASLWKIYAPWTNRAAILLAVVLALVFFRKFFKIQINVKNKNVKDKSEVKAEDK